MAQPIRIIRYLLGILLFLAAFISIQIGGMLASGEHSEPYPVLGTILGVVAVQFALAGYLIVHKLPLQKTFAVASRALLVWFGAAALVGFLLTLTLDYPPATGKEVFCVVVAATALANLFIHIRISRAKKAMEPDSAPPVVPLAR